MKRSFTAGIVASVLTLGIALSAHAKLASQGAGSVEFTATGPAGMKIVGTSDEVRVSETESSVVIVVPLAKLDTQIGLRNKHMKEKYLETDKHPTAKLTVAKSDIKYPDVRSGEATGQLELHGQTKPVKFKYAATKSGSAYSASGSFRINITDFGIEQPGYMGVKVQPDVDVAVKLGAVDQ